MHRRFFFRKHRVTAKHHDTASRSYAKLRYYGERYNFTSGTEESVEGMELQLDIAGKQGCSRDTERSSKVREVLVIKRDQRNNKGWSERVGRISGRKRILKLLI